MQICRPEIEGPPGRISWKSMHILVIQSEPGPAVRLYIEGRAIGPRERPLREKS